MSKRSGNTVQLSLFDQETVSVPWAAKYLRVSTVTVMRYREQGLIRGYQMARGGWWRLMKISVMEYEASLARQISDGSEQRRPA